MALVRDKKDDKVEMIITLFRQRLGQEKLYLPNTYTSCKSPFLCILCGSILSLVLILFSFVFGYGNVR